MTSAVIYARISDDKKDDGHGVKSQLDQCREFATDRDWAITDEYVDNDLSAYSGVNRPEFERLLADMEQGKVQRLIVWHVDRLCRRTVDLARVTEAARAGKTNIHTIKAGDIDLSHASGELLGNLLGVVAQFEARHTSERVTASHAARVEQGKFRGARHAPFGYESAGGGMLTINEGEAKRLREWGDRVLRGDSLLAIKGTEATRGNKIAASSIRYRLLNPNVAGLATFKGEITGKAVWDAIIPEDKWRDIEAILTDPKRRTTQSNVRKYQGSGIYKCCKCGGTMKAASGRSGGARGSKGPKPPAYTCRECYGVHRRIADVDAVVDAFVLGYLSLPDNPITVGTRDGDEVDVQGLRDRRVRLLERKDRLGALYAQGTIDEAQLVSGSAELRESLEAIDDELIAARESSPMLDLVLGEDDLAERWALMSPDKRAEVIDMLVEVTILPAKPGIGFDPETVEVKLKPRG